MKTVHGTVFTVGEGVQGAEARENRGQEGYGRQERKGREAEVLRGWETGEKYKMLILFKI